MKKLIYSQEDLDLILVLELEEKDKEIERLQKEKDQILTQRIIMKQEEEIERLNNIINKGIEYIQDRYDGEVLTHTFDKCNVGELLEILEGDD